VSTGTDLPEGNCWDCGKRAVWHVIRPRKDQTGQQARLTCSRHLNLTCWSLHPAGPNAVYNELNVSRADHPFHAPVAKRVEDRPRTVPKPVSPGVRKNVPKASGPGAPA
jgi:hypothetical protein